MAVPPRSSSYEQEIKELVAEQPGMFFTLLGLLVALFFGLAVRALISPEKVREKIVQASSNVHREMKFEIGEAYVSLADGFLPELAVVIRDIRMTSEQSCWMRPEADIDEMKVPLSLMQLLQGRIFVHEIKANEVNLSLRSPHQPCTGEVEAAVLKNIGATRGVAESAPKSSSRNTIDTIQIRKLMVNYLPLPFTSVQLDRLVVKASPEKDLSLSGLLKLGGGTISGDYSSQAQLKVNFKNAREKSNWRMELRGLLREGHYDLFADYVPASKDLNFNMDVRHLPLSQVIPILQKYQLLKNEINGKQVWLSLKAQTQVNLNQPKNIPMMVSDIKLEGNLGEIAVNKVEIESLHPFKAKPVEVNIQGLDVQNLLVFLNRAHANPAFGSLGTFNGTATYIDVDNIRAQGEHSGLQFIFSNKGLRETQTISLIAGSLLLKKGQWDVDINRMIPSQGLFEGDIRMKASRDWKKMDLNVRIAELILSPAVQKLMTNGGDIGPIAGQVAAEIDQGQLGALRGNLQIERMLVDAIEFSRAKLGLSSKGSVYEMAVTAASMDVLSQAPAASMLYKVLPDTLHGKNLNFKSAQMKLRTEKLKDLSWHEFKTSVPAERPVHITSEGAWNERGELGGKVKVRQNGKEVTFELSGTRELPVLTQKTP